MEILTSDELTSLFGSNMANNAKEVEEAENKETRQEITTTDDNGNDQSQESGGGKRGEDDTPKQNAEVSPNLFSSIAKALKEEGVFPDLDISLVNDAASLKKVFNDQVDERLSSQQKRVKEALDYGVEPTEIQKYERTLGFLFSLKDNDITAETKEGENLRKQLIFKDLLDRGYSEAKAKKEVEKSLSAGTDIDDAKDALEAAKKRYHQGYQSLVAKAKAEEEAYVAKRNKGYVDLKKAIDEKENAFGSIALDAKLKQQIYDNLTKPVYKTEDGDYLTAIQKYTLEHESEFMRYVGAFYTLTDGFTNFEKMFKPAAQKALKKGFESLDEVLKGEVNKDGNLSLWGNKDTNGFMGGNWKLDI